MRKLYIPAIALLIFGYPMITTWSLTLGLDSSIINLWIKALIVFLLLLSIIISIAEKRTFPRSMIFLIIFFFFYGLRLIFDVWIERILPPGGNAADILLYFFGLTYFSAVAIGFSYDQKDIKLVHKWLFGILVFTNISLFFYVFSGGEIVAENAFNGRFKVEGEVDNTAILNPIFISLMGAALSIFVMGRLATIAKGTLASQLTHIVLFSLGIVNLLVGGSRGPIVSFIIALFLCVLSFFYKSKEAEAFHIKSRIYFYLFFATSFSIYWISTTNLSISVFDRFKAMFSADQGRTLEQRDYIYGAAWEDFTSSPFFGNSYLTLNETAMPHNALLEALASMGIFGGILYIVCMYIFLRAVWYVASGQSGPYAYAIGLVAMGLAILSLTSGSIGQQPEIWAIISLLICTRDRSYSKPVKAQVVTPRLAG